MLGQMIRKCDLAGPRNAFGPALRRQRFLVPLLIALNQGRDLVHFVRSEDIFQHKIALGFK